MTINQRNRRRLRAAGKGTIMVQVTTTASYIGVLRVNVMNDGGKTGIRLVTYIHKDGEARARYHPADPPTYDPNNQTKYGYVRPTHLVLLPSWLNPCVSFLFAIFVLLLTLLANSSRLA